MEAAVVKGLQIVRENIKSTCSRLSLKPRSPRLVAVSKTKPKELVIAAYNEGQRHFGENYVNELVEKSNDPEVVAKCPEIQWHFIGHLQRNKVAKLIGTKRLYMVETVDSDRTATALDSAWKKVQNDIEDINNRLKIMVQVNTSAEDEKSGVRPEDAPELAKHIVEHCPALNLVGLMTIGKFGYDHLTSGPNPDFLALVQCRCVVAEYLKRPVEDLELSMGMSDDYEHAIELGSTNIRVGSSIFGHREKKPAAQ